MFGLTNAGINIFLFNTVTWMVLLSLLLGKTIGISLFAAIADIIGFPLPSGMQKTYNGLTCITENPFAEGLKRSPLPPARAGSGTASQMSYEKRLGGVTFSQNIDMIF